MLNTCLKVYGKEIQLVRSKDYFILMGIIKRENINIRIIPLS